MSETVTLYAVSDFQDDPHVVKVSGRNTKGVYRIDHYEGGSWPHGLRIKREYAKAQSSCTMCIMELDLSNMKGTLTC